MAEIVLSRVGAALGQRLLPQGVQVFGSQIAGAAIGRAVGSVAGRAIDQSLFGPQLEGPRIKSLAVMESREGAGIPNVYGRMRVGGQVIWAARFSESKTKRSTGGKGGPKVTEYSYSVSFAVALAEGEITRIGRVWANGELVNMAELTSRLYTGTSDQQPDPVIEAIEGGACAPAYRDMAYIVFEDLPLDRFGNRLPQLSFEVYRAAPGEEDLETIRDLVTGVNIIPASGEFVYGTEIVRTREFPGIEHPQNMHTAAGVADFIASMDQLEADLPSVTSAALTVAWFGDDLRAGNCKIRPGAELVEKNTVPYAWRAGGVDRSGAHLISSGSGGHANFGGTPADIAVKEGIIELNARGIAVTYSPFLMMDVPPGNGLADPYGGAEQAAFPWRGRITVSADKTSAARADIAAFLGSAAASDFAISGGDVVRVAGSSDWGYRQFILHQAWLAKAAGSVETFLIGSEMRALTRARDEAGAFPFVEGLKALASDVKSILGAGTKVSYAADWTEYGAYAPGDGSGDVLFPMDALWVDASVDHVSVDWYPPMADWRAGNAHLDAEAGFDGPDDPIYIEVNIAGGEAFDWYYASQADRDAQVRTPINDTAHGEHWVFRAKDIGGWAGASHHERPGGVRASSPTAFVPGAKPIRFAEIGFPAVDRGTNSPNLFYDPKSSESAFPPYSTGARDDLLQRRALEVSLAYWQASPVVEQAYVWAWDARPFPAFPTRNDIWSDGANWQFGHWLNGRMGLSELAGVVRDICLRGEVSADVSGLVGLVEGLGLEGISSVRGALEPLRAAYGFDVTERDGVLVFTMRSESAAADISHDELAGEGLHRTRVLLDKRPASLRLTYIDGAADYQPAMVDARDETGDRNYGIDLALPLVLGEPQAEALAARLLTEATAPDSASLAVTHARIEIEPGDRLSVEDANGAWRVSDITDGEARALSLSQDTGGSPAIRALEPGGPDIGVPVFGAPELIVMDAPPLPGFESDARPLVALAGDPWPGAVRVMAGPDAAALTVRADFDQPAGMGQLTVTLGAGPVGRWDHKARLQVYAPGVDFASFSQLAVLNGANAILVEGADGWELLAYQNAELIAADTFELSGLLRGLQGSDASAKAVGARLVILDEAVLRASLAPGEVGLDLIWQAEAGFAIGEAQNRIMQNKAGLPWQPAHLRSRVVAGALEVSWVRRGAGISDSWELPEAANAGTFRVEALSAGVTVQLLHLDTSSWIYTTAGPDAADLIRVAEIGADGRIGPAAEVAI